MYQMKERNWKMTILIYVNRNAFHGEDNPYTSKTVLTKKEFDELRETRQKELYHDPEARYDFFAEADENEIEKLLFSESQDFFHNTREKILSQFDDFCHDRAYYGLEEWFEEVELEI